MLRELLENIMDTLWLRSGSTSLEPDREIAAIKKRFDSCPCIKKNPQTGRYEYIYQDDNYWDTEDERKKYQEHFTEHQGLVVNQKGPGLGWTVLAVCAKLGKTELATWLIEEGANVNLKTKFGISPLHLAAESGQVGMIKLLLENGANIEDLTEQEVYDNQISTQPGRSPLGFAVQGLYLETVKYLLLQGAMPQLTRVSPGNNLCMGPLNLARTKYNFFIVQENSNLRYDGCMVTQTFGTKELHSNPSFENAKQCVKILEFAFKAIQRAGSLKNYYIMHLEKELNAMIETPYRFHNGINNVPIGVVYFGASSKTQQIWPKDILNIIASYHPTHATVFLPAYTHSQKFNNTDDNSRLQITAPPPSVDVTATSAAAVNATKPSARL